jgi:NADH dehydrogenase
LYRAPKQPVQIQKMVMIGVAGLCFVLAVALALPVFAPAGSILAAMKPGLLGAFWFLAKVSFYLYVFLWLRFTVPRYRFDQLMALGWHFLIPISIVNVLGVGVALYLHRSLEDGGKGWPLFPAIVLMIAITLLVAGWLAKRNETKPALAEPEKF